MRIAYLAVEFPTEENFDHGAGVSMGREVRALAGLGHDVTTLCWADRTEKRSFYGTPLYRIPRQLPLWARGMDKLSDRRLGPLLLARTMSRRTWHKLRELHRQQPFDIAVGASSAGVCCHAARHSRIRVAIRLSQYQPDWTALDGPHTLGWRLRDRFEVRTLRWADAIWTKSHYMADVLRERTGLKAEVIEPPFMVDVDRVDESVLDAADLRSRRFFLCLGPLGRRKGSDVIAQAIPWVLKRYPHVLFVFVGTAARRFDGMEAWEWVRAQAGPDAARNVRYLGKVPRARMFALIAHAQATVIAARTDNLPNASYETMGGGNILVASRHASFEQLVDDGCNGFLFDNGDPASLADVLLQTLCLSERRRRELGANAKRRVDAMSPDRAGLRLAEFLERTIRNTR